MQTGYIDYDKLEEKALDFRPKLLICGGSAYPREWDYKRLAAIAKAVGAYLLMDMAHIRCARLTVRAAEICRQQASLHPAHHHSGTWLRSAILQAPDTSVTPMSGYQAQSFAMAVPQAQ